MKSVQSPPTLRRCQCSSCHVDLPIRLSQSGEEAALWRCAKCSAPFMALAIAEELVEHARRVTIDASHFDVSALLPASEELKTLVVSLGEQPESAVAHDRRRSRRLPRAIEAAGVLLDEGLTPIGDPLQLMVADVSREGIGFIHSRPLGSKNIAIQLPLPDAPDVQLLVRVVRNYVIDRHWVKIGGEFTARLGMR